jgi:hypothetical protein
LLKLDEPLGTGADGMPEALGVCPSLRTDRHDDDGVGDALIERPPGTSSGARSKLAEVGDSLDLATVREWQLITVHGQFLEGILHRVPFRLR